MIRPEGFRGAAFGDAHDGDGRKHPGALSRVSAELAIPNRWAWVHQVHGADVLEVVEPGLQGEADAAFTRVRGLPLAVSTADCVPVILEAEEAVGVAHAGWRGAAAGVVRALVNAMAAARVPPVRAAVGPAIGPCCFEVGPEVAERFPDRVGTTDWGTVSVDLRGAVTDQLDGLPVWVSPVCTMTDLDFNSHRRDKTTARQVAIAWLPG